jgi:hypothetical protein
MHQNSISIEVILKTISVTNFNTKIKLLHLYSSPDTSIDDDFLKLLYVTYNPFLKYKIKNIINLTNIKHFLNIKYYKNYKINLNEAIDLFIKIIQSRKDRKTIITEIKNIIKSLSLNDKTIFLCVLRSDLDLKVNKYIIKKIIKNRK